MFDNMTIINFNTQKMLKKQNTSLFNNVIYDSNCDFFFIHDKSRFVDNILSISFNLWCDIFIDEMLVEDYEIMKMIEKKNDNNTIELLFKNIVYMLTFIGTLMSAIKMRKKDEAIWNMNSDHLRVQNNRRKSCKIQIHYRLIVLEYNEMQSMQQLFDYTYAIQSRDSKKAIS